ncbi:MAG: RNA-binding protein [Phaeodactylibacter sp.]|nr:RNA-binding protein [Phaeodactylibacter sp.]
MNIFIARLSYDTSSEDLQHVFEEFGEVSSSKVIMDYDTGRSKGYGFVEMDDEVAAVDAINELNDSELHGRTIVVKKARPRNERRTSNNYNRNSYNRW